MRKREHLCYQDLRSLNAFDFMQLCLFPDITPPSPWLLLALEEGEREQASHSHVKKVGLVRIF